MKTPKQIANHHGIASVKYLSNVSGVPYSTLIQWAGTKPDLYRVICIGCRVQQVYGMARSQVVAIDSRDGEVVVTSVNRARSK